MTSMSMNDSSQARGSGKGGSSDLTDYRAPTADILQALDVAGLNSVLALPTFSHLDRETVELAIIEFGRFASKVLGPTDRDGDREGSHLDTVAGVVRTPESLQRAYRQYIASGWGALPFPSAAGGGGFPSMVGFAVQEMFASANLALSLNPALTQSAVELLLAWGTESQQSMYLPKLLTGEWSGTMNLTEPEAGSDLGEVQTRAVQDTEGRWRISGTKIFITWGEHDLTDNIIHLVLARVPGASAGTKGLSLFLVPKVMVAADGSLGQKNSLRCLRTEEKLGIHASPTCVMEYDQAIGELVGEVHGGIRAMFVMMNTARLAIGLEGTAVAERAFQLAFGIEAPRRSSIIDHPDVRRMLLDMRTSAVAGRLLIYMTTQHRDIARHSPDEGVKRASQAYMDLLTPVAKAWSTDVGFAAASTGVQILGGAGYMEESGMAQRLRDSRIPLIYEGTNGIQAIDLVMRKLPRENGRWIGSLLDDIAKTASSRSTDGNLRESYICLGEALAVLQATTKQLLTRVNRRPEDALSGATAYLELIGITLGGWLMVRRAEQARSSHQDMAAMAVAESEFFATEHTARACGLVRPVLSGAGRLAAMPPDLHVR